MGNTTTTERPQFLQRDDRRFQEIVQERSIRAGPPGGEAEEYQVSTNTETIRADSSITRRTRNSIYGIFRRQPVYQNPSEQGATGQAAALEDRGDEQEERPLMTTEDAAMSDAPTR